MAENGGMQPGFRRRQRDFLVEDIPRAQRRSHMIQMPLHQVVGLAANSQTSLLALSGSMRWGWPCNAVLTRLNVVDLSRRSSAPTFNPFSIFFP
ncbi:MAG: hypothetical protein HC871_17260 [Rhizobiales bacterium]|nr:hypothetical protein [Hyphomicrobiales bacterium]